MPLQRPNKYITFQTLTSLEYHNPARLFELQAAFARLIYMQIVARIALITLPSLTALVIIQYCSFKLDMLH